MYTHIYKHSMWIFKIHFLSNNPWEPYNVALSPGYPLPLCFYMHDFYLCNTYATNDMYKTKSRGEPGDGLFTYTKRTRSNASILTCLVGLLQWISLQSVVHLGYGLGKPSHCLLRHTTRCLALNNYDTNYTCRGSLHTCQVSYMFATVPFTLTTSPWIQ